VRKRSVLNITLLTKEYPPRVYGGAGVHVSQLAGALAGVEDSAHRVRVLCFGDQRERNENLEVTGVSSCAPPAEGGGVGKLVETLGYVAAMAGVPGETDVLHAHTWYTHLAGCLLRPMFAAPLVLTTHSLEPHRPWKEEQLGRGYRASCWIERTGYGEADGVIAVSNAMKQDVQRLYGVPEERIEVIPNGVDHLRFRPRTTPDVLEAHGIDPARPYVLLVARMTRQKGISHFLRMGSHLRGPVQVVLCASSPDTRAVREETAAQVEALRSRSPHRVVWEEKSIPPEDLPALYGHAAVFVCPSVYEPFGIINLEAMACGTPVVASLVGGVPDAVVHGETGFLVPFEPASPSDAEPGDPERFARDLAAAVDRLLDRPDLRSAMAEKARRRVEDHFSWPAVADRTLAFYRRVAGRFPTP
jgi:alpha-maltose-1-phosphate synthase